MVCRDKKLQEILNISPLNYNASLEKAFSKIRTNDIISSWKDAYVSSGMSFNISDFIEVPSFGCLVDSREKEFNDKKYCVDKIWAIGGENGWYHGNWLWVIRGFLDKLVGGVGIRRGRTNNNSLNVGDALDFWRVLYANKEEGRLLLFAEMKLPGEAWLEFKIKDGKLFQKATFRPLGVLGRMYWFSVLPFHSFIFQGMINKLTKKIDIKKL